MPRARDFRVVLGRARGNLAMKNERHFIVNCALISATLGLISPRSGWLAVGAFTIIYMIKFLPNKK